MQRRTVFAGLYVGLLCGVGAFAWASWPGRVAPDIPHAVAGLDPMDLGQAEAEPRRLLQALLSVVYAAYAETGEEAVYDLLARVAADPALEALYLERAGALARGGLTGPDQTIHGMEVTALEVERAGRGLRLDARWQVIGTVGHGEHTHLRGNTYSAVLEVTPVAGAWRITAFELREVLRAPPGAETPGEDHAEPAHAEAPGPDAPAPGPAE